MSNVTDGDGFLTDPEDIRSLIENLGRTALWLLDPNEGELNYMSPGFEDIWGRARSEVLEDPSLLMDSVHAEDVDRVGEAFERARGKDPEQTIRDDPLEYRVVQPNGEVRWVEDRAFAIYDEEGNIAELVGIATDITDRKRYEQELQRQNERLDRFAEVVSHDLRNPLSIAVGHLELARNECDTDHHETIEEALDRMDALIDDVLSLARDGDVVSDPERTKLEDVARASWLMVSTDGATLDIDGPLGEITADQDRLRQVFENLFRNSVEHGSTNKRDDAVELSRSNVTVRVGRLPDTTGFYVEDDGPGIPEGSRPKVFEPGYSTATEAGAGLGLSIIHEIVEAHNWEAQVTEGADGGARFEFRTEPSDDE